MKKLFQQQGKLRVVIERLLKPFLAKKSVFAKRFLGIALTLFLLPSCVSLPTFTEFKPHSEALLEPNYFSVDVPSFDGTKIKATIYQPALGPNETAPVVIHAHGFAFFRMSRPFSLYGNFMFTGKASLAAWKKGYWVVSFDHRGHGASGGKIHLMDSSYEVKDLVYLLDWIENNIPRISYKDGDPLVGMIGESYGGGAQMLGAGLDKRIDAIVPVTTWHDFNDSLAPQGVPKSGWLGTLILAGNFLNPGKMQQEINQEYRASRSGSISENMINLLNDRSISEHCNQRTDFNPTADVLFIQGFRDVLFPLNEAKKNADCFKKFDRDVRILATQDGHLLPFSQFTWGTPAHNIEKYVHCGNRRLNTIDMTLSWFDEKLKQVAGAADNIPKVCLTHDYASGSIFTEIPMGGVRKNIQPTRIKSGFAGFFEFPMRWVDKLSSLIKFGSSDDLNNHKRGGRVRPAFIPLEIIHSQTMIAGIPQADLHIESQKTKEPRFFIGVGIKHSGSNQIKLISDQVTAIKGTGNHKINLSGLSSRLKKDDVIGLVVHAYNDQFRLSGSGMLTSATISGSIKLPIFDHSADNKFLVQAYQK